MCIPSSWFDRVGRRACGLLTIPMPTLSCMCVCMFALLQQTPPWWGVIYREVLSQGQVVNKSSSLSYGMLPEDVYTKGVADARDNMCDENNVCE